MINMELNRTIKISSIEFYGSSINKSFRKVHTCEISPDVYIPKLHKLGYYRITVSDNDIDDNDFYVYIRLSKANYFYSTYLYSMLSVYLDRSRYDAKLGVLIINSLFI